MPSSSTRVRARVLVCLERLGLPARAVQREHQLRTEPLAQGRLGEQSLELGDDVLVAPECEFRVDLELEGAEPQLFDARRLGAREVVVAEVLERGTAEEPERLGQQLCLLPRRSAAGIGQEPLEEMEVELVLFEPERVAGLARRDSVAPEQLPQRRDMTLHCVAGSRRRPHAPERVDGFVHRDHLSGPEQQQRE